MKNKKTCVNMKIGEKVRIIKTKRDFLKLKLLGRLLFNTTFIKTKKHSFYNLSQD